MSSTKGGGGKTTLAAHLAVEAVKHKIGLVAIIDTDPQASLAGWWNLREAETPAFVQTTLKDLPTQLAQTGVLQDRSRPLTHPRRARSIPARVTRSAILS
jgi:cellulose biosynthesis protein BcsQ